MTAPRLINPQGKLAADAELQLFLARKSLSLWARQVKETERIESLEGVETAQPGDYVCRGTHDELWPQRADKLLEKYEPQGEPDRDGWQRFDPRPEAAPVEAAQLDTPFRVVASWGELTGKAHDYVVRSRTDPSDIWIVDRLIFEASYSR